MATSPKLRFPQLRRVQLRRFSLFSLKQEVDEDVNSGVFCLAGANGLGKSTFLSAANYAITGIVSKPDAKFFSVSEYYKDNLKFAQEYFDGRIKDSDREAAEVSVELVIGDQLFSLTRGLFDTSELREFSIRNANDSSDKIFDGDNLGPSERDAAYRGEICSAIGIGKFEQFVFLQHYVLTFDERRHLLFWDSKVLEQGLFIAFGVDHETATRADSLRREAEKADSLVRNSNWQATKIRTQIDEIKNTIQAAEDDTDADLVTQHQALTAAANETALQVIKLEDHLRDRSLAIAELSAKQSALHSQYTEEFTKRLGTTAHLRHHPIVATSISEHRCALCGDQRDEVNRAIEEKVESGKCPLCGWDVRASSKRPPKDISRLKGLDSELTATKSKLDDALLGMKRLRAELAQAVEEKQTAQNALSKFEKGNRRVLAQLHRQPENSLEAFLETLKQQMESQLDEKRRHTERRDSKRREFKKLQKDLASRYAEAEDNFVPKFQDLAFRFVGIDLNIQLETSAATGTTLILTVAGSARREHHQLSESQRFFIDIALRMALIQYMAGVPGGTLFIDTPEGSLDIAYENRAGGMLAAYVLNGFDILMTANINSSRLLLALAQELSSDRMHLCRMTSWTELSEVQVSEEHLFEEAYAVIEEHLRMRRAKPKKKTSGRR
jgi:DNA repair exonuclease SbcCD ATPase subunit